MPGLLAFVGGGLLGGLGKGLVMEGKAKREAALKKIEQEGALKRALELEETKQENRRELKSEDRAAQQKNALALKLSPELPSNYQRTEEGGVELMPGYLEGQRDLAAAKRDPDGGATSAQRANNREIDEARKRLREMEQMLEPGVSLAEEIHRRIGTTDPATGRRILDYNSFLGRTAWQAMQRKIGPDQEQARWSRVLINPPEFTEPAGPKALLPGVSAEKPDVFDSVRDFFSGGNDQPAPQPGNQQAAPARPQALDRFPGRAPSSVPQPQAAVPAAPPRLANGGIDRDRLVIGQVYRHPVDGRIYRWTGDAFEAAD